MPSAFVAKLKRQAGVRDAEALAAWIGRFKQARQAGKSVAEAKRAARGNGHKPSTSKPKTDPQREQDNALFKKFAGKDLPKDPAAALNELHGLPSRTWDNITDEEQDRLEDLDARLTAATKEVPGSLDAAGLNREKFLGRFDSLYEADGWASGKDAEHRRNLTPKQRSTLNWYKRGGYQPINSKLRRSGGDTSKLPDKERGQVEAMDEALKGVPRTDRPVALFRRGLPPEVSKAFQDRNEAGLVGQVFGDDGFGSTTRNKDWDSQAVGGGGQAYLVLPKGGRMLDMEGLVNLKGAPEYEALLPRGTRYRITKVSREGKYGDFTIEAEIIQQGDEVLGG